MSKVRLYVAPRHSETIRTIRLLDPEQKIKGKDVLYKDLPSDFSLDAYEIVEDVAVADFVVIPQAIWAVTPELESYFSRVEEIAQGKKIIIFISGDSSHRIHIDRKDFILFNGSYYAQDLRDNEIVPAAFSEDIGAQVGVTVREKGARPLVSFCGYAGFPSLRSRVRYYAQNMLLDIRAFLEHSQHPKVYKRGIFFRRQAINYVRADKRIDTSFVIRSFFTANRRMIKGDPVELRKEFIDSIVHADFVLAPKGDANFSSRFYETLSLGRIPVLVDTEMLLPFKDVIDYSRFVVRVPFDDLHNIGNYIVTFWESLSEEEFKQRQQEARSAFRNYLRYDSYFNRALPLLKEGGIPAVERGTADISV